MPDEAPETPAADAAAPAAAPPVVAPVAEVIPASIVDAPPALAPVAPTLPPPSPAAAEVSAPVVAVAAPPAVPVAPVAPVAPVEVTPPYLVVAGARHPITITRRGAGAVEVSVALPDGSASAVAESERAALSLLGRIHGEVVT